jgi:D-alanyl-D-alanine carboxypeptidase
MCDMYDWGNHATRSCRLATRRAGVAGRRPKRSVVIRSCVVVAAAAIAVGLPADSSVAAAPPGRSVVDRYLREHRFVGTALVGTRREVVFARAYGYADRERAIPNSLNTLYRVTWLASQFTDVAILQLVDARKLTLDTSICSVVPRCPRGWRRVTVRSLATYRVIFPLPSRRPPATAPLEAWIQAMRTIQPIWRPLGERPGSVLIQQYIVERVAGVSWWTYVRDHIVRRAGMTDTRYDDSTREGRRAIPYDKTRPLRIRNAQATPDRSDGIVSTVRDFFRYSRALDNGRLLSEAMRREMSDLVPGSGVAGYYGVWRYGWLVTRTFGHLFEGQHAHGEPGWSAWFIRLPEDGLTLLLFQNKTQGSGDTANGLVRLILGCPSNAPPTPKPC